MWIEDLLTYVVAVASTFDKIECFDGIYFGIFVCNMLYNITSDTVLVTYRIFLVYRFYNEFSRGIIVQAGKTFLQIVLKKQNFNIVLIGQYY